MWQEIEFFLYGNPVAPAVVGLGLSVVLGAYWLTRVETRRGERPEGPAAAHPAALLVQAALVLWADRKLLFLLLGWSAAQSVTNWAVGRAWSRHAFEEPLSFLGSLKEGFVSQYLAKGSSAVQALRDSLPGALQPAPAGTVILAVGLILAWLLLRHALLDKPAWAAGELRGKALGTGALMAALSAIGVAFSLIQTREYLQGAQPVAGWGLIAVSVGLLPLAAFVGLCLYAAIFEVATELEWTAASVARRVVEAYWPWLAWTALLAVPALAGAVMHVGKEAWLYGPPERIVSAIGLWAPVLLFPVPWLLLQGPGGLGAALARTFAAVTKRTGLVILFAVRFVAIVGPVSYLLGALDYVWGQGLAPMILVGILRSVLSIICAFVICRASLSIQRAVPPGEGASRAEAE